ncbi:GyrI-like domain-containing protein [Flagellimonas myxillae]|uniref:GyrI-like domain-containing protein n=1 Tax=Flagellimonas myxillae TaxID=2942214 RepID=UPI00201F31A3|nr:GyrI-like domain-containing protein [Muricauda myxillae]MCL6267588.1 GyrI-like domain-containing protein [Muricauda myxillae]
MMKKFLWILTATILIALAWYLFIKPSDYTIRFESKISPGAINQTIKLWDQTLDGVTPVTQIGDIYNLSQKVKFNDSIHSYTWEISPMEDSITKVVVGVRDEDHSLANKLKIPFSDTDFEKRSRKTVLDLMENIADHASKFKVTIVGEEDIPEKYLAYVPIKCTQIQKAGGMMKNLSFISQVLLENQVQLNGPPMIQVTKWDMDTDSLEYNFGHPIIRSERLPIDTEIMYKRIFPKRALKAIYNGNYITSDRAWYALLDYAQKNNILVENKPVEVFYNNPNMGGDEMEWKAEIYLPIKESNE